MAYADLQSQQAVACWKRQNAKRAWKIRARRYNISEEALLEMWATQDERCAICQRGDLDKPHVDHDHQTGRVRGILCASCNRALGIMQDSPARLEAAAEYLRAA